MELGSQGLVSCFTYAMGWKVEGYGQMLVLLDGDTEPLLAVFGKVIARQERHRQRNVGFGWSKIAIKEALLMMWRALLRPGSSRLAAMRLMA